VVVEVVHAQPTDLPGAFSSWRMWVNGVGINRYYFGNASTGNNLFVYPNNPTLDICVRYYDGDGTRLETLYSAQVDMMNLLWYIGTETAWNDLSGMSFSYNSCLMI